jgi:hypothetical protein
VVIALAGPKTMTQSKKTPLLVLVNDHGMIPNPPNLFQTQRKHLYLFLWHKEKGKEGRDREPRG